jgi:hypothetical protein
MDDGGRNWMVVTERVNDGGPSKGKILVENIGFLFVG